MLLARDRIGKKPLCYALTNDGLIFGSEIKAILAWPGVSRSADLSALHQFLTFQYVPAPLTAFAAVKKLPPAHKMVVGLDEAGRLGESKIERYWRLPARGRAAAAVSTWRRSPAILSTALKKPFGCG
jgi:asparagine synthase (glutamine-hydrolysing)